MIRDVTEDGRVIKVVPNRKLGKYLQRRVTELLAKINLQLNQVPDAEVLSDDDAYIGRVAMDVRSESEPLDPQGWGDIAAVPEGESPSWAPSAKHPEAPVVHLRDVAAVAFSRALGEPVRLTPDEILAIDELAEKSGFNDAIAQAETISDVSQFETETGFAVIGSGVAEAIMANGERPIIRTRGNRQNPGVVRIEPPVPACTVVFRFTDGRGAALAALHGFIGHVVVQDDGVVNVNYVPSVNSFRWQDYVSRRKRVDQMRAAAAAAVRFGVFRLDDKQEAAELAQHIRVMKGLDPSLGLYAAYAYSEADRRDDIDSVLRFMNQDLRADLFDVAMLARKITNRLPQAGAVAPFCPMLTQGWNLLRVRGITLPRVLDEAQDELEQSLWTTFKPQRAQLILEAIRRGEML
jgi:hypothetical protein